MELPWNYRFPAKGAFELPREQVINHVLLHRGILKPDARSKAGS
jgi:hypothetical protein